MSATNKNKLLTELSLTTLDKLFLLLGNFITLKLLADRLDKSDFGAYSLGISLYVIISMFPFTAVDEAVARYWSIYTRQGIWQRAISLAAKAFIIMSAIYLLLAMALKAADFSFLDGITGSIIAIVIFSISEVARISLLNIENVQRNRAIVTASNGIVYTLRFVFIIVLHFNHALNLNNLFLGFAVFSMVNAMLLILRNKNDYKSVFRYSLSENSGIYRDIIGFSRPMIIWGPFIWSQNMINRWLLDYFSDQQAVAEYVTMGALATLVPTVVFGILWTLITPLLYSKEDSGHSAISKVMPAFSVILFLGFVVIYFFSDIIVEIIFPDYVNVSWMIIYLYIPAAFIQLAAYASNKLYVNLKTRELLLPNILPGLTALIFGIPLINYMNPLYGAVANTMVTGLIYTGLMMHAIRKHG